MHNPITITVEREALGDALHAMQSLPISRLGSYQALFNAIKMVEEREQAEARQKIVDEFLTNQVKPDTPKE